MKKDKNNNKGFVRLVLGISMVVTIVSFFIVGMLISNIFMQPVVENQIIISRDRSRVLIPLGDAPFSDASKFYYVMIYPHQADPGTAYASNLSNATAYEYLDTSDGEMTGETPKATTFDIVIKVGVTDSDGHNGTAWQDAWHYCWITCADLSIGADTNMTQQAINEGPNYAFEHYYVNNGGSGYTVDEDEAVNITSIKFYVYRIV